MFGILAFIERDLYREPLHDLDVISCSVFRGQQTESRSAGPRKVQDVAVVNAAIRVDRNLYWLAGANAG